MSSTDGTTEDARAQTTPDRRHMLGILRRVRIRTTGSTKWGTDGVLLMDSATRETIPAEVFSNVGFFSRPAPGVNAEAILGNVGGAENPCLLATRDEDTRRKVARLDQDETATFNSSSIVHHKKDGTIELRAPAGTPQKTMLGEAYRTAEDSMLSAVSAAIALIASIPGLTAPQIALVTAATGAIAAFQTAAASYLTQVVKVQ